MLKTGNARSETFQTERSVRHPIGHASKATLEMAVYQDSVPAFRVMRYVSNGTLYEAHNKERPVRLTIWNAS